jgi:hypothetical protein
MIIIAASQSIFRSSEDYPPAAFADFIYDPIMTERLADHEEVSSTTTAGSMRWKAIISYAYSNEIGSLLIGLWEE